MNVNDIPNEINPNHPVEVRQVDKMSYRIRQNGLFALQGSMNIVYG